MFLAEDHDKILEWLDKQIKYTDDLFRWKVNTFARYHITVPKIS